MSLCTNQAKRLKRNYWQAPDNLCYKKLKKTGKFKPKISVKVTENLSLYLLIVLLKLSKQKFKPISLRSDYKIDIEVNFYQNSWKKPWNLCKKVCLKRNLWNSSQILKKTFILKFFYEIQTILTMYKYYSKIFTNMEVFVPQVVPSLKPFVAWFKIFAYAPRFNIFALEYKRFQ